MSSAPPSPSARPAGRGPRQIVMVIDDDPDIRDIVRELLDEEEYQVLDAQNGAEALRVLRASPVRPSVILLDWMMPVMNGEEFCRERLLDPGLAAIPVVVLTASRLTELELPALGVDALVPKPVRLEALLGLVARYCDAEKPAPPR